ncbi:MAG: hypothetical protein IPI21_17930 [Propionivibrio sp.]|nr:hypothetical protein [Propionivibrio sp.]
MIQRRALNPQTSAPYRDGFVLFLEFAEERLGKAPAAMALVDVTPELIMTFLIILSGSDTILCANVTLVWLRYGRFSFAGYRDVTSLQVIERPGSCAKWCGSSVPCSAILDLSRGDAWR